MNTAALCFCFILILLPNNFVNGHRKKLWTFKDYPDIRGKPWGDCGKHIPQFGYICDPEPGGLINAEDGKYCSHCMKLVDSLFTFLFILVV